MPGKDAEEVKMRVITEADFTIAVLDAFTDGASYGFKEGVLCYLGFLKSLEGDDFAKDLQRAVLDSRIKIVGKTYHREVQNKYQKYKPLTKGEEECQNQLEG